MQMYLFCYQKVKPTDLYKMLIVLIVLIVLIIKLGIEIPRYSEL